MDENSGFVYAVINPSLEGLARIEVTKGDPLDGAKDLSIASNAPLPYIVIFQQWFNDCAVAAEFVHNRLAEHLSADNPGFFRISTTNAVLAILEARSRLEPPEGQEKSSEKDSLGDTAKRNRRKFCEHLLTEGQRFQYGDLSLARDEEKAIRAYEKAIEMNCVDADRLLGTLYFERSVLHTASELDLQKALKYYDAGISKGNTRCWGDAARCYEKLQEYRKTEICWGNFWELMKENFHDLDKSSRDLYTASFQEFMTSPARLEHRELTRKLATRVGKMYIELPEGKNDLQYETLFAVDLSG